MVTGVSTMAANALCSQVPTLKDAPVKSDRRSNKPIMEKRRRARINNCLNELKTLILDATKKDPSRHSKLEKADILEKTVKHLQELQRQQAALQKASDPKIINKFRAGFTDCANEVSQFPGLDTAVKHRLLQHLSNCINGMKAELHYNQRQMTATPAAQPPQQLHSQMLPSPPSSPEQDQQHHHVIPEQHATNDRMGISVQHTVNGYFLPNGLQVIPTKLSNGSIALVLPQSLPQHHQQAPKCQTFMISGQQQNAAMIMQTPSRTASTGSASSQSSSSAGYERVVCSPSSSSVHYAPPSPANSYEAMDCKPSVIQHANMHHQQLQQSLTPTLQQQQQQQQQQNPEPLSLVIKKNVDIKEEEQPWRPW